VAAVNEADLPSLRCGQNVAIEVRAWPGRKFHGQVLKLGESLDPATRTLQVRVQVPNAGGLLKPGMFATVLIDGGAGRSAMMLPGDAVQSVDGHSVVFIQTSEETFEPRTVVIGESVGGRVEISEGIKAGERIAVQGSFGLKSAMLSNLLKED
jgi:cobalt-zinc-cadmium efflux system membrane fusion protein